MGHLRRRLALIALAMAITLAVGTAGFVWIENYPVFDAFYMTLTTVTTVGYGELHPLHRAGRIFNSCLILFGVITMIRGGDFNRRNSNKLMRARVIMQGVTLALLALLFLTKMS